MKKLDLRGGHRKPKPLKKAQSRLLQALWSKYGGMMKVSRLLGVHHQYPVNWKIRGRVPLHMVGRVARGLNIPMWGLNYEELYNLHGSVPSWNEAVKSYNFDDDVTAYILRGIPPKKASLS